MHKADAWIETDLVHSEKLNPDSGESQETTRFISPETLRRVIPRTTEK